MVFVVLFVVVLIVFGNVCYIIYLFVLGVFIMIFFMWGFFICLNDILVLYLKLMF